MKNIEEVKIVGKTAQTMLNVLRNSGKISFPRPILGKKIVRIEDGNTGKVVFPDDDYHYNEDKGNYLLFNLEDGSEVIIRVNKPDNSLIFEFSAVEIDPDGLRETVLSYIDYDYGRD
jgi:hypothetical protein